MPNEPMDAAAQSARLELEANWRQWSAVAVGDWWRRWFGKAGHNRLGRVLMEVTGQSRT